MIKKPFLIAGLALICLVLLYLGFSLYIARQIIYPSPSEDRINISAKIVSSDYEDITIKSSNNVKLKGWLFHGKTNNLIIMIAGFKQNRINNDYYGVMIAKELVGLGYSVLLYDNQATGESDGNYLTFGIKESKDLLSVVDFARKKGFKDEKIGIIGDSMGAISLLLASDHLKNIGALVVDSPANNVKRVMRNILKNENNVPSFFHPAVFSILKYIYNIDLDSIKPSEHVAIIPERIFLFLHGGLDTSIYPLESRELLTIANPKSKLVIFPKGKHIETYKSDPDLYRKTVFSFLSESIRKN